MSGEWERSQWRTMFLVEGVEKTSVRIDLVRRMGTRIDLETNQLKVGQQAVELEHSKSCPSMVRGTSATSVPLSCSTCKSMCPAVRRVVLNTI